MFAVSRVLRIIPQYIVSFALKGKVFGDDTPVGVWVVC